MVGPDAKGLPNDTVATLTPFVLGQDLKAMGQPPWSQWARQEQLTYEEDCMYYWNQSLPYGFFSRSPMAPVTGSLTSETCACSPASLHCPQSIHKSPISAGLNPEMHRVQVKQGICCNTSQKHARKMADFCA